MWMRATRRSAFHASSFPKSLIFRMVFVLQNVKFMLLLAERTNERQIKNKKKNTFGYREKREDMAKMRLFRHFVALLPVFHFVFQSTTTTSTESYSSKWNCVAHEFLKLTLAFDCTDLLVCIVYSTLFSFFIRSMRLVFWAPSRDTEWKREKKTNKETRSEYFVDCFVSSQFWTT